MITDRSFERLQPKQTTQGKWIHLHSSHPFLQVHVFNSRHSCRKEFSVLEEILDTDSVALI